MLYNLDVKCFYFINKACAHPALNFLMSWITDLGSGEFIVIVALILLAMRKKECRLAGILLLAGLTLSYQIVFALKHFVARPRPFAILPGVTNILNETGFSFPSYHAVSAFMTAAVLSSLFRKHILFFGLAAAVGFSRVYFGVHFPSDVIAGAVLGTLLGYMIVYIARRAQFPSRPRSSIG